MIPCHEDNEFIEDLFFKQMNRVTKSASSFDFQFSDRWIGTV